MAVCFSVNPGISQLPLQCQSPSQISTNKTRNSTVALPTSITQKCNEVLGSKISDSTVISETDKQPTSHTLVDLLRDCATKGSIKEGKLIHGSLLKSNFNDKETVILLNHVAHMYLKCSDFTAACMVFEKMPQRNVFSWTVMIVGSTDNGFFFDGFSFFCEMLNYGILADKFSYSAVIQSCIGLECIELGEMVHAQIIKRGFSAQVFVSICLLNMYAKLGRIEDSVRVFNTATEHNQVSWNAMISGFTLNGLYLEAFNQFLTMKREDCTPNMYTFASVLKAVGKVGDIIRGREVHKHVTELGMESDVLVGTALIDMYSKCGCLCDARSVFDKNFTACRRNMPWNAMISAYLQGGCSQEALELFIRMRLNNVDSDVFTYCSVFSAISILKCLGLGREVHALVVKFGHDSQILSVNNAIADAYSKCGSIEDASKVFEKIKEKDMVSWTTMVTAYVQCSEAEKALSFFTKMREEGFTPNQFTFSSVLVACSNLLFIEYGQQVHGLLCKGGLTDHECIESALIDMYAKCGSIIEAEKVLTRIMSPDVVTWTAIISGYALHGFTEKALQLFRRMEELQIKANAVTILCILFACSHGGMVEEGLHYFQSMEERYSVMPKMEHYACVVDLLGRAGRLDDAMQFIKNMPIEPADMVWQTLLGACRVHGNIELGEIAAKKILSARPEFSATYVLLSNTYIEMGSLKDGLSLRNAMKERGVKKEPGFSWICVKGIVHKFFAGDKQHPQKEEIYAELEELREKMKAMGYEPDLKYVLQDMELEMEVVGHQ